MEKRNNKDEEREEYQSQASYKNPGRTTLKTDDPVTKLE